MLWVLALLLCPRAYAQTDSLKSLLRQFDRYRHQALQEKLFLHLDRPFYAAGETMWFKVYAADGSFNKPLDLSRVAYVEVLNAEQRPVLQGKIGLADGTGQGSFLLPPSLASGRYTVRAYTNWMKNFDPEYYFQQTITLVNTTRPLDGGQAQDSARYTVQFFPEGGQLVRGLAGKVAFKVSDSTGQGLDFQGQLLDPAGQPVLPFQPSHRGMGFFTFSPAGSGYRAVLTLANGQVLTRSLPPVADQGLVMHLDDSSPETLKVRVQGRNSTGPLARQALYLLVHARQQAPLAEGRWLESGEAVFLLPRQALAEGISHLTLFNSNKKPVCERLFFSPPKQKMVLDVQAGKKQYGTREKVSLEISSLSVDRQPEAADLSVAVYQLNALQGPAPTDISSYLWLTSELRGAIEAPAEYLAATPQSTAAADLLMLTQGWRRFRWETVLQASPAPKAFAPEINGHLIRGKVSDKLTGAPAAGIATFLASPSKQIRLYNATSNRQGGVQFEVRDFHGPKEIIVQSDFSRDSTYHFEILNPFSESYGASRAQPFHLSRQWEPEITQRHLQSQVQQAYFSPYRNLVTLPRTDSSAFYGKADETYRLDDFTRFPVMEEVMREYVPGVLVRIRKDGFHFLVANRIGNAVFSNNPMVLLDGVPVFNINKIMAFDPRQVQQLDVMTSRYFQGQQVYDGLVSYTTYQGDLGGFPLDARALLQEYEGLQIPREFYVPPYETEQQRQSRLPDLRNLLYWNPRAGTPASGQRQLTFFTSDQPGTYLVVIQGFSRQGAAGTMSSYTFEVKAPL